MGACLRTCGAALAGLIGVVLAHSAASAGAHHPAPINTIDSLPGAAIYLDGRLPSGRPLLGMRDEAQPLSGAEAACVSCHRRSGFGSQEGRSVIPPITGQFLFQISGGGNDQVDLPYVPGARANRQPYTEATLARAIREGIDPQGRSLSKLMPHYALSDADLAALVVHLRSLDRRRVPGVSDTELHFATIVTPDADPIKRKAMLDVLAHFVEDRNNTQRLPTSQSMLPSSNALRVKGMFKVTRHWVLHVWEPTGVAATWTAQLQKKFAAEPVFAVISGLAGPDWSPVQAFCEQARVPCLFPNVELPPVDAENNFYSLYFSRGVRLEADLIARQLTQSAEGTEIKRVRQIFRLGDVGEAAASALEESLRSSDLKLTKHGVPAAAPASAVAEAVAGTSANEVLVLWLRPQDLAALPGKPVGPVYVSDVMGDVDANQLPAAWRGETHAAYPFDLPELRRVRVDYAFGWFRIRGIPVTAPQVQADTYLTCGLLSETLKHMVDTFVPDYLVERLEDTTEHRIITGYYPHLTLGPHQRFSSKGGYLVHLEANGTRLLPDGPWMTP